MQPNLPKPSRWNLRIWMKRIKVSSLHKANWFKIGLWKKMKRSRDFKQYIQLWQKRYLEKNLRKKLKISLHSMYWVWKETETPKQFSLNHRDHNRVFKFHMLMFNLVKELNVKHWWPALQINWGILQFNLSKTNLESIQKDRGHSLQYQLNMFNKILCCFLRKEIKGIKENLILTNP